MHDWIEQFPVALTGAIDVGEPNTPVKLYEGRLKISRGNEHVLEDVGFIELSWFPSPALRFRVPSQGTLINIVTIFNSEFLIELLEANMQLRAVGTYFDSHILTGVITGAAQTLFLDEKIQRVTFYIPNFIDFIGESVRDLGRNNPRSSRMSSDFEDWQIIIDALPNSRDTYKALNNQGGYAITHVGKMEKSSVFITVEEIETMYKKLYRYLSFCRGAFCGPLLFSGYNADGAIVWKDWSIPRVQTWKSQNTWFPTHKATQTKQVLRSYLVKTRDEKWDEVLRLAIHWLTEAQNAPTEEIGIVNAQIGIELLGWAKFVEIDQALSKDGFNKLTAIDRIQLLLFWANIPADIPPELKHLTAVADNRKKIKGASEWRNGPTAIIELRNSIAHPNLRDRTADVTGEAKYEVRQLAIWYLELLILRFLNYQGEYHNRLEHKWAAKTEFLPWLTETQN